MLCLAGLVMERELVRLKAVLVSLRHLTTGLQPRVARLKAVSKPNAGYWYSDWCSVAGVSVSIARFLYSYFRPIATKIRIRPVNPRVEPSSLRLQPVSIRMKPVSVRLWMRGCMLRIDLRSQSLKVRVARLRYLTQRLIPGSERLKPLLTGLRHLTIRVKQGSPRL